MKVKLNVDKEISELKIEDLHIYLCRTTAGSPRKAGHPFIAFVLTDEILYLNYGTYDKSKIEYDSRHVIDDPKYYKVIRDVTDTIDIDIKV